MGLPDSHKRPIVSIIITAYNAEKYLKRCLESILAQSFKDFEVVFINDGSTDHTRQIVEEAARADGRFRIIHQTNHGVAFSRNVGLALAQGEFMIHIDADDYVEPNMLEDLVNCALDESADMVICDYFEITSKGELYRKQKPSSSDSRLALGDFFFHLHGSLWNKLIRLSTVKKYGINFLFDLNTCEDQLFSLRLLSKGIRIAYLAEALYHYDTSQNADSLVNRGIMVNDRLAPLEIIAKETDISRIQNKYDNAICLIAYQYLFKDKDICPDYSAVFRKHVDSIRRAHDLPLYVRGLVLLRILGLTLPVKQLKKMLNQ